MRFKWTGSLGFAVVAALSGACGGGGSSGGGGGGPTLAVVVPGLGLLWVNQQRVPTSSHLRAVRFANNSQGLIAGEATNFLRTDNGGGLWSQQEHTPLSGGGDVAGMDVDGTRVRAVGSDALGGKVWDSPDTVTWDNPAAGSGSPYVAVDVERGIVAPFYAVSFRLRSDGDVDVTDAPENPAPTPITVASGLGGAAHALEVVGAGLGFWYVGGENSGGTAGEIRRTPDFGFNWGTETLPGGTGIIRDLFFGNADDGFACGDNSTVIQRTAAGGSVWADISGNLPAGMTLRGIFFPSPLIGWVVGNGGNIWKTSDGGTTWIQQVSVPATTEDLYDVWFVGESVGYAVGNNGMVLKCTGGGSWSMITRGDLVTFNAVDFTPDGLRGIAVGNSLGGQASIYRTNDGGLHWELFNTGAPAATNFYGVSIPRAGSGNVAYVCGAGGTILRNTAIGGAGAWTAMTSNAGANDLRAILFPDDNDNGICVGDGDTIVHTLAGTTNPDWTVAALVPAADYKALSFARDGAGIRVYAAGTAGVVAQATTFPSPTNWTALPVPAATTIQALSSVPDPTPGPDVLFAAGANNSLYRLAVGAVSWTTGPPASAGPAANGLVFSSLLNGWWVSDAIYTTIDGGATWQLSPDHTKSPLRAVWVDAAGLVSYAAGDKGTILKSLSGGKP